MRKNTNVSATGIREATELIASIASQTNLLSLNASIEAASTEGASATVSQLKNVFDEFDKVTEEMAELSAEFKRNYGCIPFLNQLSKTAGCEYPQPAVFYY